MSVPWPPPPDLESIKQLVREADVEDLIALEAPADEYDGEAQELHAFLADKPTEAINHQAIMPALEVIWRKAFSLDEQGLQKSRPGLLSLAKEIERFFGPESKPRTREEIIEAGK